MTTELFLLLPAPQAESEAAGTGAELPLTQNAEFGSFSKESFTSSVTLKRPSAKSAAVQTGAGAPEDEEGLDEEDLHHLHLSLLSLLLLRVKLGVILTSPKSLFFSKILHVNSLFSGQGSQRAAAPPGCRNPPPPESQAAWKRLDGVRRFLYGASMGLYHRGPLSPR